MSHRPDAPLAALVTVTATDGLLLPALYYQPLASSKRLVIYLHGMGPSGIFYSVRRTNALATGFIDSGTAFLGLQNRGGGMLQGVKYYDETGERQKRTVGTSHELIADCVHDIEGAIEFGRSEGFSEFYLAGHSTGANKIALYSYLKPENPFTGYVLFGGGDDTGLYYEEFGKERFERILAEARKQVKAGNGEAVAPVDLFGEHFSYQSIVDILDPDGGYNTFPFYETQHKQIGTKPLWREFQSIAKPTLVVYGELDEYVKPDVATGIEILKQQASDRELFTFRTIPGADHGCYQHEAELAEVMADWVTTRSFPEIH
jgi:pimeloyl-ACP methyl ester carboxylesterase